MHHSNDFALSSVEQTLF